MTYYTHGDRRQRGLALLALRRRYEAAGLELDGPELPDHLPAMLEFAAIDPAAGAELLADFRPVIELVRAGARAGGEPVGGPGRCALRLRCRRSTTRASRRSAASPARARPGESVGLEPFAPPEVMPAAAPTSSPACAGRGGGGAR